MLTNVKKKKLMLIERHGYLVKCMTTSPCSSALFITATTIAFLDNEALSKWGKMLLKDINRIRRQKKKMAELHPLKMYPFF